MGTAWYQRLYESLLGIQEILNELIGGVRDEMKRSAEVIHHLLYVDPCDAVSLPEDRILGQKMYKMFMQHPNQNDVEKNELALHFMSASWKHVAQVCADKSLAPIGKNIGIKLLQAYWIKTDLYTSVVELETQVREEYANTPDNWAILQLNETMEGIAEESTGAELTKTITHIKFILWAVQKWVEYDFLASCIQDPPEVFSFFWEPEDIMKKIKIMNSKVLNGKVGIDIKLSAVLDRNKLKTSVESASGHRDHADTAAFLRVQNIKFGKEIISLKRRLIETEEEVRRLGAPHS